MTATAILFDCEFLVCDGAPGRFWCGPGDPDPTVVQIGAVRLTLEPPFDLGETFERVIQPRDRTGQPVPLDPLFTRLTGLTQARVAAEGVPLATVLAAFDTYSEGAPLWSWGKDEFNLIAISCFVEGLPPPIPATRFHNAARLLEKAGEPRDRIHDLRSHTLMAAFGLTPPEGRAHDALTDARHVALTLQHLLRSGRLTPSDFAVPNGLRCPRARL